MSVTELTEGLWHWSISTHFTRTDWGKLGTAHTPPRYQLRWVTTSCDPLRMQVAICIQHVPYAHSGLSLRRL